MGAATEREPEVVLEDGLRKRKEGAAADASDATRSGRDGGGPRVTPLTQVWKPSQRTQDITVWVLLLVATFFSVAVVIEELQASWYRSPALDALNNQIYGADSLDAILRPHGRVEGDTNAIQLRWNVSQGVRNPDGVKSKVYLINDEFPGPTIHARPGDLIQLDVINALTDEELNLTFGGLLASGRSLWGTKSAPQKAVTVGATTTYEFQIPSTKLGTFSYRAASEKQTAGGVFGAFIVSDPTVESANHTVDEARMVVISDWSHPLPPQPELGDTGENPVPASFLINGIGAFNCSQIAPSTKLDCVSKLGRGRPNMKFDAGRSYRLRFINAGTTSGITFAIPGTYMTIIEMDGGQRVQPKQATSVGVLRPGQTVDVLIQWAAGGDDEFILSIEDDAGDGTLSQKFPIKVSGFLNSIVEPPSPRHRDILRLKPMA